MWLIVQMRSMLKTKLSCRNLTNHIQSMMKTEQDNDVTNHIGLVYVETKTKLSGPIWLGAVSDET